MLAQGYFKGQRSSINKKLRLSVSWRNQYELIEWQLRDAPTSIYIFFLLLLLYLITIACILEIS